MNKPNFKYTCFWVLMQCYQIFIYFYFMFFVLISFSVFSLDKTENGQWQFTLYLKLKMTEKVFLLGHWSLTAGFSCFCHVSLYPCIKFYPGKCDSLMGKPERIHYCNSKCGVSWLVNLTKPLQLGKGSSKMKKLWANKMELLINIRNRGSNNVLILVQKLIFCLDLHP